MTEQTSYIWTPPPDWWRRATSPRSCARLAMPTTTGSPHGRRGSGLADGGSLQVLRRPVLSPYDQMLDLSRGEPWARWCVGGTTNIVLNCIDRHRGTPVWDQTFLVWEGETAASSAS